MYEVKAVGRVRSTIRRREDAPKQGHEGAPDAWIDIEPGFVDAIDGLRDGDEVLIITWLDRAHRDVLKVHPRGDPHNELHGVFATRSPDRPNPVGVHPVTIRSIDGNRILVGPLEAFDGTPVIDIKPVLPADFGRCTPRRA